MSKPIRIVLDALAFARLVNGKEVEQEVDGHTVKIILSDIGFDRIAETVIDAFKQ